MTIRHNPPTMLNRAPLNAQTMVAGRRARAPHITSAPHGDAITPCTGSGHGRTLDGNSGGSARHTSLVSLASAHVSPAPAQHTRAPASHRHTFRSFSSRAVRAAPPAAISSSILILDLVSWRACRVCLMGCGACWSRLDTCASMARCATGSVSPKPDTRDTDCAPPKPCSVNHVVGLQPPAAALAAVGFALSPG